jgi:hypothetical protein
MNTRNDLPESVMYQTWSTKSKYLNDLGNLNLARVTVRGSFGDLTNDPPSLRKRLNVGKTRTLAKATEATATTRIFERSN